MFLPFCLKHWKQNETSISDSVFGWNDALKKRRESCWAAAWHSTYTDVTQYLQRTLSICTNTVWIIVDEMRSARKQASDRLACLSGYWLRIKSKECERCWRGKVWNLKMQGWTQTKDFNKARGSPQNQNAQSIIRSYQVECCVRVLRCWCPVGVPESQCGKGVRWTRSWRRSRCPPQQPPCGTPPCPPPDGPPTASAWLAQDRTVLMVRLDIPVTSGSQEVWDKYIYYQYFLHYEL